MSTMRRRQSVQAVVTSGDFHPLVPDYQRFDGLPRGGRLHRPRECLAGTRTVEQVIETLSAASLRGLGGAGFPTGKKWQFVRAEKKPRLMAVNGDEGEPGTFKDRYYLEREPHRFLEGMLIAAWAVEAEAIYLYLRDEYPAAREILIHEIAEIEKAGLGEATRIASPPRRRRLYLRRGIGDARIDRGQARLSAPSAAIRRAGRHFRSTDAGQQHRDAVLDSRNPESAAPSGSAAKARMAARDFDPIRFPGG